MFEDYTPPAFESPSDSIEVSRHLALEASLEVAEPSLEICLKSAKQLSDSYRVTTKTIQTWFKAICTAYFWIDVKDLKTGSGNKVRYTPLCQALVAEYRSNAHLQSEEDWIASVHAAHPEKLPTTTNLQPEDPPISPTKVLPPDSEQPWNTPPHFTGLSLHLGSSLSLPAIPSIVTPGNETAYLTQAQQRLQQFEALQQQVLSQIQQQQQAAAALNAQYQEATSLSDRLLLQEFQLKGVQLGYTALQLKQQAFKATVQAAEAGTLPVPGKPQPETEQPQSA